MKDSKKVRVFLGGTCNKSTWRDELIPKLTVDYFNPVVDNWTEDDYKKELMERETCDVVLYVLTPKMTGFYSVAEVVDDSNKRPEKAVFCFLLEDEGKEFSTEQLKSLKAVVKLLQGNGVPCFMRLESLAEYVNKKGAN